MKKDIKDYLHFYLGCEIKFIGNDRTFLKNGTIEKLEPEFIHSRIMQNDEFKLMLHPLSDLTVENYQQMGYDSQMNLCTIIL